MRFPGRYRPGLIEARADRGRQGNSDRPFRGVIAPASLKRQLRCQISILFGAFPGRYRPGLIEAAGSRAQPSCPARFPGRYRPGLIEAPWSAGTASPRSPLSGALSPRPH